jgi:hypothetical protein
MSTAKTILGIVPGLQATALVGNNLRLFKKPTSKKFMRTGVKNLLGVRLIGATSQQINLLD